MATDTKKRAKRGVAAPLKPEQVAVIRSLYEAGADPKSLAAQYGVAVATLHSRASRGRWATPQRVARASGLPVSTDDPATSVAALWAKRKEEGREERFAGATKALRRFFAMSPVPQSFHEAEIAERMIDRAIEPDKDKENTGNTNIAFLVGGFQPKIIDV